MDCILKDAIPKTVLRSAKKCMARRDMVLKMERMATALEKESRKAHLM